MKIKIKVNDKVQIMTGKDKGKNGKVLQVLPDMGKIVVEGINIMYKHIRSKKRGEKGQRVQFNGPIAISNVKLLCPKCNKPSRLAMKVSKATENAKQTIKARVCKKCNEVID